MNNRIIKLGLVFFLSISSFHIANASNDFEIIRQRVIDKLMQGRVNDERIEELIQTIGEEGSWSTINYSDVSRTGFDHSRHLNNMVVMSRAFKNSNSGFYKSTELRSALVSALEYWARKDFICDNWWWNQIGTPNALVSILLIMDEELPAPLIADILPVIGRAHLDASGARPSGDRIKVAGILAKELLYSRDEAQFNDVIRVIEGEVKFSTGRGMQYDYSFHHRVDRVNNTLSYGLGYAEAFVEWVEYVDGTEYAFSEEKLDHLIDYYLDGICKTMVFGKYPDPGAKNRSISRRGTLRAMSATTPKRLIKTTDYRKSELEEIIEIREDNVKPTTSHSTYYWHSEHYTHQRPDYYTSVRMYSSRNHNMEVPYNSEGLLNHHRGDGTNHISLTGDEYRGIWPVYDWQKIPGTTVLQKHELPSEEEIQKPGLTDFVGAVTDGRYGAAAFDFKSPHDPLEAKKAWFFFDEEYVCLGTGISSRSDLHVATTLNQCLLNGEVTVAGNNKGSVLAKGEHELNDVRWVYHNGVAYLFPEPSDVKLNNIAATGSWFKISRQHNTSKDEIKLDVFKLWIDHGSKPVDASYQYIIVPSISEKEIDNYSEKHTIEILANTTEIQAVKHSGLEICQLVFYNAAAIQITDKLIISCSNQGVVMVKTDGDRVREISVSDPSRKLSRISLSVSIPVDHSGSNFKAAWNEEKQTSEISVDLPQGNYAGQSVTIRL